jgi:hypothetical protein
MSLIRRPILTIGQNSFCHILCLFAVIWQTMGDELEEINIGPGDKTRPTFISKKLDSSL